MTMLAPQDAATFGAQLRRWRARRRFSQLDLAGVAAVSTRHLSFLENGRSKPSPEMVLHLAEVLDVPLEARNELLTAAGFAPVYPATDFDDDAMQLVRDAVSQVLAAHEPNPAIVVDRRWNLLDANAPAGVFMADVAAELLEPPVNVIELSLHPDGLARSVVNFGEYASHLLWRLRRQVDRTADAELAELLDRAKEWVPGVDAHPGSVTPSLVLPMRVRWDGEILELFSTIAVFGAPLDVTLDELAIEAFYPRDDRTAQVLAALAA